MPTTHAVDRDIAAFLREKLESASDTERVVSYLGEKNFSTGGQAVVASIFAFAKENGVSVEAVIVEVDKEWDRNWYYQHPETRGSLGAPGVAGLQNRVSLNNIYSALGIPNPNQG